MDEEGPPAEEPAGGDPKIAEPPRSSGDGSLGQSGYQFLQVLGTEAIEKEVGDDQVETAFWQWPSQSVRTDILDAKRIQAVPLQSFPGQLQHAGTRIDARQLRRRPLLPAFKQETAVAFAQEQHPARRIIAPQECGPAPLQFVARQDQLEPAVMWRQKVETHREKLRANNAGGRHQSPARIPPMK